MALGIPNQIGIWKCWFLKREENWRKTLGARREPITNSIHTYTYMAGSGANPGQIGGGGEQVLPPLHHPCSPVGVPEGCWQYTWRRVWRSFILQPPKIHDREILHPKKYLASKFFNQRLWKKNLDPTMSGGVIHGGSSRTIAHSSPDFTRQRSKIEGLGTRLGGHLLNETICFRRNLP